MQFIHSSGYGTSSAGAILAQQDIVPLGGSQVGTAAYMWNYVFSNNLVGRQPQFYGDTTGDIKLKGPATGSGGTAILPNSASTYTLAALGLAQTFTADQTVNANVIIGTAGKGLQIKEGSNARMGTCTLSSGSCTVSNTSITSNTRVFVQRQTDGGTVAASYSITRTAGTSFTITAKDGSGANQTADTSTVAWWLAEPAP